MNNIFLSKSSYCKCVQCEKILWLEKYRPECLTQEPNESLMETGRKVGELAKGLFGEFEDVPTDKGFNKRLDETKNY